MLFFSKLRKSYSSATLIARANILFNDGKYQEAANLFEQALQTDPTRTEAWTNLGSAYERLNRLEEAEKAHLQGTRGGRGEHIAWVNLGTVYRRMGKLDEEMRCYEKSLSIKNDFAGAWMKIGVAHLEAGKFS